MKKALLKLFNSKTWENLNLSRKFVCFLYVTYNLHKLRVNDNNMETG